MLDLLKGHGGGTWGPGGEGHGGMQQHNAHIQALRVYFNDLGLLGQNPVARVERGYPGTSETNPRAQARPLPLAVVGWSFLPEVFIYCVNGLSLPPNSFCTQPRNSDNI